MKEGTAYLLKELERASSRFFFFLLLLVEESLLIFQSLELIGLVG